MHDLYRILDVSEDDVDADLRYRITYILREGMLDLSEAWVHRPLIERFRGYTHQNAVRLQRIAIDRDDCIVFDLQLVNPEGVIAPFPRYEVLKSPLPEFAFSPGKHLVFAKQWVVKIPVCGR